MGYSLWGRKESDMTSDLACTYTHINQPLGEISGDPRKKKRKKLVGGGFSRASGPLTGVRA